MKPSPKRRKPRAPRTYDAIARAQRIQHRGQRLGPSPHCARCGIADPDVLTTLDRSLFEAHHPLGHAHAPMLTAVVCLNCHQVYSVAQSDDGVPLAPQPTTLERHAAMLVARGSFFRVLAEADLEQAQRVRDIIVGLDNNFPTWRSAPWATC